MVEIAWNGYTWQQVSENSWDFGLMVRGVVRHLKAQVYYDKDCDSNQGGWIWLTLTHTIDSPRGNAYSLQLAVEAAERALGVPE